MLPKIRVPHLERRVLDSAWRMLGIDSPAAKKSSLAFNPVEYLNRVHCRQQSGYIALIIGILFELTFCHQKVESQARRMNGID